MTAPQAELSTLEKSDYRDLIIPPGSTEERIPNVSGRVQVDAKGNKVLPEFLSPFFRGFIRTTWHSLSFGTKTGIGSKTSVGTDTDTTLTGAKHDDIQTVQYLVDTSKHDFHSGTYVTMRTPAVRSKNENLKIAWTPNYAIFNCIRATYKIGNVKSDDITCHWMMDYYTYDLENSLKPNLDRDIGNISELTEWSNELPERDLTLVLPFNFSFSWKQSTLLSLWEKKVEISHELTLYKDPVKSALRFQYKKDQKTKTFGYMEGIESLIEYDQAPLPDVKTLNANFHENERSLPENQKDFIYVPLHQVTTVVLPEKIAIPDTKTLELSSDFPVAAISAKAVNLEARSRNYHGNYTDNPDDHRKGKHVISSASLYYGEILKCSMTSNEANSILMRRFFKGLPRHQGFYMIPLTARPFEVVNNSGVILPEKTQLRVTLDTQKERKLGSKNQSLEQLLKMDKGKEEDYAEESSSNEIGELFSEPSMPSSSLVNGNDSVPFSQNSSKYMIVYSLLSSTWFKYEKDANGIYSFDYSIRPYAH